AWISTRSPARSPASRYSVYQAVPNADGIVAASTKLKPTGLWTTHSTGATTWDRKLPGAKAITASPTEYPSTPSPTAVTTPAHSMPSGIGPPGYSPRAFSTSRKFSPTATTSISTSPGPGDRRVTGRNLSPSSTPGFSVYSSNGRPSSGSPGTRVDPAPPAP